jgi:guanylate kinase
VSDPDPYRRVHNPLLIVISGPSGVGKDSLLGQLKASGHPLHVVVTATSRPKRPNEVDGRDYHFVSPERFRDMIEQGELLEYALVYGDYKGIPKQQVREALASGKDVILRLDVQGAATIRRLAPEALSIFMMTGDEAELIERLRARHTETDAALQVRLGTARQELSRIEEFDYIVVNREDSLAQAAADVLSIIRAEHCRTRQRQVSL